jgi:hypothetical protein
MHPVYVSDIYKDLSEGDTRKGGFVLGIKRPNESLESPPKRALTIFVSFGEDV